MMTDGTQTNYLMNHQMVSAVPQLESMTPQHEFVPDLALKRSLRELAMNPVHGNQLMADSLTYHGCESVAEHPVPNVATLQAYNSMSSNGDTNCSPAYGNSGYSTSSNTTPPTSAHSCNSNQHFSFSQEDSGVNKHGPKAMAMDNAQSSLTTSSQHFEWDSKMLFSPRFMQSAFESPMQSNAMSSNDRMHDLFPSISSVSTRSVAAPARVQFQTPSLHDAVASFGGGCNERVQRGVPNGNIPPQIGRMAMSNDSQWNRTRTSQVTQVSQDVHFKNPPSCNQQCGHQMNQVHGSNPLGSTLTSMGNRNAVCVGTNRVDDAADHFRNQQIKLAMPSLHSVPSNRSKSSLNASQCQFPPSTRSVLCEVPKMQSTASYAFSNDNHSVQLNQQQSAPLLPGRTINGNNGCFGLSTIPSTCDNTPNASFVSGLATAPSFNLPPDSHKTEKLNDFSAPLLSLSTVNDIKPIPGADEKLLDKKSIKKDKFQCTECGKQFKHKSNLKIHQIIHSDEALKVKPSYHFTCYRLYVTYWMCGATWSNQCSFCDKKFARKGNLKQHLRVHTDERPYSCCFCPKKFKQPHSLKDHLRIHTGEKPFSCEFCAGERPFDCTICSKRFASKSSLNGHSKKFHPKCWKMHHQ